MPYHPYNTRTMSPPHKLLWPRESWEIRGSSQVTTPKFDSTTRLASRDLFQRGTIWAAEAGHDIFYCAAASSTCWSQMMALSVSSTQWLGRCWRRSGRREGIGVTSSLIGPLSLKRGWTSHGVNSAARNVHVWKKVKVLFSHAHSPTKTMRLWKHF